MSNDWSTSDVSLPVNLPTFTSAPLSHSSTPPDYLLGNDHIGFRPQSQSSGNNESGSSCGPLRGSFSDASVGSLYSMIYPPLPESFSRYEDGRSGDWDQWHQASVCFATLLQKCSGLDRAVYMLKDRDQRSALTQHLVLILRTIYALCDLCATFVGEHPPPCAKKSLDPTL